MTLIWKVCFQLSVGQLGWALPAEVGSTRLRQKTIVLARNTYYIAQVIANTLQPYFMNPSAWNLRVSARQTPSSDLTDFDNRAIQDLSGVRSDLFTPLAITNTVLRWYRNTDIGLGMVPPSRNQESDIRGIYQGDIWSWARIANTVQELDVLFAEKTPARKFKQTQVNAFDSEQTNALKNMYAH